MIQRNPFSYPTTATEIQRLERRLRFLLSAHAINFPPSLAVANIACGRADETGALARALEPSKFVFYLGLDLRTHCRWVSKKALHNLA